MVYMVLSRLKNYGTRSLSPLCVMKIKITFDHSVFVKKVFDDDFIIVLFFVDNIFVVQKNISRIDKLKKASGDSFVIKTWKLLKRLLKKVSYMIEEKRRFGYKRRLH